MKNIFGVNITGDKHNTTYDGEVFIKNTISPELNNTLDETTEHINELEKEIQPTWIKVVRYISGLLAVLIIAGIIRGLSNVTLSQAYENAPYMFYAVVILSIVWFFLFIREKIRKKNVIESEEFKKLTDNVASGTEKMYEELNIPPDAVNMDFLSYQYKIKNGNIKIVSAKITPVKYINIACLIYVRDGSLHIYHARQEWVIPLDSFTGITKINKRILIPFWNKEVPYNKDEYKQYKLTSNQYGISVKPYYEILIKHGEDDYCLSVPSYELEALSSLIGIEYKE